MKITATTTICMVIGDPVKHSVGPKMYNAVYEHLKMDDKFVYLAAEVKPAQVEQAIKGIRALGIRGVSVTIPHKQAVIPFLDVVDDTAKQIGAVNTIVNDNGILKGYNTDYLGVVTPLEQITTIEGKKVALIGAGGAARAVAYGIIQKGGLVTIFNRTLEHAQTLAQECGCAYRSMEELETVKEMDIIFNATSVGLHPNEGQSPLAKTLITKKHIVFDAVYNPYDTQLLQDAAAQGATVIHGLEMLLYQGVAQFEMYTGEKAPAELMREILLENLKK